MQIAFGMRTKILLLLLAFTVIPVATLGLLLYGSTTRMLAEKSEALNHAYLQNSGMALGYVLETAREMSLELIQSVAVIGILESAAAGLEPDPDDLRRYLVDTSYTLAANPEIHSIAIYGLDRSPVGIGLVPPELTTDVVADLARREGGPSWMPVKRPPRGTENDAYFGVLREIRSPLRIDRALGYSAVTISPAILRSMVQNLETLGSSHVLLVRDDGEVLFWSGSEPLAEDELEAIDGSVPGRVVVSQDVPGTPLRLVGIVDPEAGRGELYLLRRYMATVLAALATISVVFAVWISRRFVRPIQHLTGLLASVEGHQYRVRAPVRGNDEIASLSRQFNSMVGRIGELIHEVYLTQLHQREAELAALQAQINPHFLYNTLHSIYLTGRSENALETSRLVKDLSQVFRAATATNRPLVSLEEEIDHLESYVRLQQRRLDNRFGFEIHCSSDALQLDTIRLVLQPVVENAIIHGIEESPSDGTVSVRIAARGTLTFTIEDNGVGMTPEREADVCRRVEAAALLEHQSAPDTGRSIGLPNVARRLALQWGEVARIQIESRQGRGTVVTIVQPLSRIDRPGRLSRR